MAGTAAQRAEYSADVAKAAGIRNQLLAIESRSTGPRVGQEVRGGAVDTPGVHAYGATFTMYGIPPPGQFGSAADQHLWNQLWPQYPPLIDRIRVLYGILFPPASMSQLEEILSVVGIAAAGLGAYAYGAEAGAAAAGAGASGGSGATGAAAGATGGAGAGGSGAAASGAVVGGSGAAGAAGAAAGGGGASLQTVGVGAALSSTSASLASSSSALAGAGSVGGAAAAASAASTAGSLASTLGKGVSDLTGSSTLGDIVSAIVGDTGSVLSQIEQFVKPITDFAKQVLTGIDDLNKQIIQPLSDTVLQDYNSITGLVSEVKQLAHSGLQGILAIPSAISQAFTGLDAANQRLVAMQSEATKGIVTEQLVPGIGGAISNPLAAIHATLSDALENPITEVGGVSVDKVDEASFDTAALVGKMDDYLSTLYKAGWLGKLLAIVMKGFVGALGFFGSLEHLLSYGRQAGNLENPVTPLDASSVIRAWWRGQISPQSASIELGRQGFDQQRQQLLHDLEQYLPSVADALRMYYRLVISDSELEAILKKQGLSENDIAAVIKVATEPVSPAEYIAVQGRATAMAEGFLQSSLGSDISSDMEVVYGAAQKSPEQAKLDWLAHWDIQNMGWWLTAWFRGIASDAELELAAKAHNIPSELIPKLASIEAETIQLWMIPDMLASGLFTDAEAADYLHYIGIGERDAALIIKYGKAKANAGKGPDTLGLGKIADATAKQMLQDGIIDKGEYSSILTAHGYTPQAAALMADLAELQIDLTARKTYADNLLIEFEEGLIDLQTLQSGLASEGFTQTEIQAYTNQAQTALIRKSKKLSNVDIKDFLKANIFTADDAISTLIVNGWNPTYAQAFVALWTGAPPPGQTTGAAP